MKRNWMKRTLCGLLAGLMLLGNAPAPVFAAPEDGLCQHHPAHTEACGYAEGTEGSPCTHEHTEDCYTTVTECVHTHGDCGYVPAVEGRGCDCAPDESGLITHAEGCGYVEAAAEVPCGHVCSGETGCVTQVLNCQHTHDDTCGYAEARAEIPCGFVCTECDEAEDPKSDDPESDLTACTGKADCPAQVHNADCEKKLADDKAAEEEPPQTEDDDTLPEMRTAVSVWVNPLYAGQVDPAPSTIYSIAPYAETEPYTSLSQISDDLREAMKLRIDSVTFSFQVATAGYDTDTFTESLRGALYQAMNHTGVPTEGDYLQGNFRKASFSHSYPGGDLSEYPEDTFVSTITYQLEYNTDADQEEEMDAAVSNLLATLNPTGTDYQKLRTVYDYITANIAYDHDHLNDEAYTLKFSAYAALVNKTAVCQGYATLLYRLALEMGIDARMITGLGGGGNHAWNILKLDGLYYNADATWDAGSDSYSYFLVSDANFPDHTRESQFSTSQFYASYPMGSEDYTESTDPETVLSGSCGENLTFTLTSDGVLTITGSGKMTNYSESSAAPWYSKRTMITSAVIGDGVTSIGSYAFYSCYKLATVSIPDSVTAIEYAAFRGCSALTAVAIPEGVTTINIYTFYDCTSLTNVSIPEGVTTIASAAFSGCSALTAVTIPESVTAIESGVFSKCSSLASVNIPAGVTTIEHQTFLGCSSLTSVLLPEHVTSLESGAFSGCSSLKSMEIPASVSKIGNQAFSGCSALESVTIPEGVTSIESCAFSGCNSLKSIVIPEGVTSIDIQTFSDCSSLKSAVIPKGVTSIGSTAFKGCSSLESIVLPEGLTSIGSQAFYGCSSLTSATLSKGLTSINVSAFESCSSLESITIPEGVTTMGSRAFYGCSSLTSATILEGLTSIADYAFENCSSLESVTLPESITTIGVSAFRGCGLTSVTIPEGVTTIGDNAFFTCRSLVSVTIPESVSSIGTSAFGSCSSLESITIPEGLTSVSRYAFSDCSSLESITLPEGLTSVSSYAFDCCKSLESITIPQSVTSIDANAFYMCPKLTQIRFDHQASDSLEIGDKAFFCNGIETTILVRDLQSIHPAITGYDWEGSRRTVTYSDGNTQSNVTVLASGSCGANGDHLTFLLTSDGVLTITGTGAMADYSLASLAPWYPHREVITAVTLPEGLTAIGKTAFYNCASLTSITLPGGISAIPDNCFAGSGLTGITIPKHVTSIAEAAFSECHALRQITFLHEDTDSLNIAAGAFALAVEAPVNTDVTVADIGCVHPAISGYDWIGSRRFVTWSDGVQTIIPKLKLVPLFTDGEAELIQTEEGPRLTLDRGIVSGSFRFSLEVREEVTNRLVNPAQMDWSVSDSSVASLTVQPDAALVTIPASVIAGSCAIQAAATDGSGLEAGLQIRVLDYTPKLDTSARLALNSYRTDGTTVILAESGGNTILDVTVYEYDSAARAYRTQPSDQFIAEADGSLLTLNATKVVSNGTWKLQLAVTCANQRTYRYPIQLRVDNRLPSVTVRQTEKFNLFRLDSSAGLTVTSGEIVTGVDLRDTEDFRLVFDSDTGTGRLYYSDSYRSLPGGKVDTAASLSIQLANYRVPVVRSFNISTVTTKPKLSLTPSSSVINTALNPEHPSTVLRVWNQTEGAFVNLETAQMSYDLRFAEASVRGDELTLTLTGTTGGTAGIYVRAAEWAQSIKLTHKVSVDTRLPTVKLAASTLKLNSIFSAQEAQTAVFLSQSNLKLESMTLTSTAAAGSALRAEADKLSVYYDSADGCIHAKIKNPEVLPKKGTYSYKFTAFLPGGKALAGGTVRISVTNTLPRVSLSTTSVKLNQYLAGQETAAVTVKLTGDQGYRVIGFRELENGLYPELSFRDGVLSACLTGDTTPGRHSYRLTPILLHEQTGQTAAHTTVLTLNLQVYNSSALGVSLSARGKLDTLNPNSAIVYTVSQLKNCSGTVDGVTLKGPDAGKFQAALDTSGAKPTVRLTLKQDTEYATNITYRVQLCFRVCGKDVLSSTLNLRVSQSALKLASTPASQVLFQSQSRPLTGKLTLTAPAGASLRSIAVSNKTSAELLAAMDEFQADIQGTTAVISLRVSRPGMLKAGRSYSLYLDVTPTNCAGNIKPTQIRLTVKVQK